MSECYVKGIIVWYLNQRLNIQVILWHWVSLRSLHVATYQLYTLHLDIIVTMYYSTLATASSDRQCLYTKLIVSYQSDTGVAGVPRCRGSYQVFMSADAAVPDLFADNTKYGQTKVMKSGRISHNRWHCNVSITCIKYLSNKTHTWDFCLPYCIWNFG